MLHQFTHWLKTVPPKFWHVFIAALILTTVGGLLIKSWAGSWRILVSSLGLGFLFGFVAYETQPTLWVLFWTMFGTFTGPGLVVVMSSERWRERAADEVIKRLKGGKG